MQQFERASANTFNRFSFESIANHFMSEGVFFVWIVIMIKNRLFPHNVFVVANFSVSIASSVLWISRRFTKVKLIFIHYFNLYFFDKIDFNHSTTKTISTRIQTTNYDYSIKQYRFNDKIISGSNPVQFCWKCLFRLLFPLSSLKNHLFANIIGNQFIGGPPTCTHAQ